MKIVLSDPVIIVYGWLPEMDGLGQYTLRTRKTPEELKEEKAALTKAGLKKKPKPYALTPSTVISKDADDPSIAYFLPGLWPRIKTWLDTNKIQYEIDDQRNPDIRPQLDLSCLQGVEFRENQDVALALVASADCGVIETATAWGKSFIISLICKALPTLNILVCTSATTVVSTLCSYLNKQLPGQVGMLCGGKNTSHGKRIVVSTLKSLPNINPALVHLVLVDECHAIGDNLAGQELMKFQFARRFGFSASPIRNDGSQIVLESILGPTILKMTYQESVQAGMITPMKYHMLRCSSGPAICNQPDVPDVLMKRWGYWKNIARNKAIQSFVYDLKKVYDGQILIMVGEHYVVPMGF